MQAHKADLQKQSTYGVSFLRFWFDESEGRLFCLVAPPSAEAAAAVHREAHGLIAEHVYQVQEGT